MKQAKQGNRAESGRPNRLCGQERLGGGGWNDLRWDGTAITLPVKTGTKNKTKHTNKNSLAKKPVLIRVIRPVRGSVSRVERASRRDAR